MLTVTHLTYVAQKLASGNIGQLVKLLDQKSQWVREGDDFEYAPLTLGAELPIGTPDLANYNIDGAKPHVEIIRVLKQIAPHYHLNTDAVVVMMMPEQEDPAQEQNPPYFVEPCPLEKKGDRRWVPGQYPLVIPIPAGHVHGFATMGDLGLSHDTRSECKPFYLLAVSSAPVEDDDVHYA